MTKLKGIIIKADPDELYCEETTFNSYKGLITVDANSNIKSICGKKVKKADPNNKEDLYADDDYALSDDEKEYMDL